MTKRDHAIAMQTPVHFGDGSAPYMQTHASPMEDATTPTEAERTQPFPFAVQRELPLKFAESAFRNNHDLVCFLDQKASLTITAVGVLTTALSALMVRALNTSTAETWQVIVRGTVSIVTLSYLLMAFLVIVAAAKVLVPATKLIRPDTQAFGLLFPYTVLNRLEGDEDIYFERISQATTKHLLREYASQIVESANVYQSKHV